MAAPTNTPLTGDIWHLSIDDLFSSLPETPRLGGAGPFVINLSASTAPISLPKAGVLGNQNIHVYQIQRVEDRRLRYRLRLGPFLSEDEADAVLRKARDMYPGALTATAEADDLRAIAAVEAKEPPKSVVEETSAKLPEKPAAVEAETSVQRTAQRAVVEEAVLTSAIPQVLTLEVEPAVVLRPAVPAAVPPTLPVSTKVLAARIPTLQPPPPPKAAPRQPPQQTTAAAVAARTPLTAAAPNSHGSLLDLPPVRTPARVHAAIPPPPKSAGAEAKMNFETTQTVRALTPSELQDDQALRWYVIQLFVSEEPFDPETVPDLDIFSVYRLYSVASIDQGRIMHALRLGFFGEEIAAVAVSSYLAAYYDKPIIKRVSVAERERFANQRLEPRKDVGATGKHAVIEITNERYIREKRSIGSEAASQMSRSMLGKQPASVKK